MEKREIPAAWAAAVTAQSRPPSDDERERRDLRGLVSQLRRARLERGWTVTRLARVADIDRSRLSRIENGSRPRLDTLWRLARALDLRLELTPDTRERERDPSCPDGPFDGKMG